MAIPVVWLEGLTQTPETRVHAVEALLTIWIAGGAGRTRGRRILC
jgi:hypothetical protein